MTKINKNTVLEIIYKTLSSKQIEASIIYWDKKIIKKNDKIRAGFEDISMPFDGEMIFVDLMPQKNWAHPCLYLLVNTENLQTDIKEAHFPPYLGEFPKTFIVVLKYGKELPKDH